MEQATVELAAQSKFNKERIASLMSQREQSGVSVKEFCESHHITAASYYYWRKKLLRKDKLSSGNQQAFTMLRFDNEASGSLFCEMTTPGGGRLRFYQPVAASFLQSLL